MHGTVVGTVDDPERSKLEWTVTHQLVMISYYMLVMEAVVVEIMRSTNRV